MTAPRHDTDRPPAAAPGTDTRPPAADSFPATGVPPVHGAGAAQPGVPAELLSHPSYEVLRELGRGGMGVVYLARNKMLDRLEVLKVMQAGLGARDDLLRRFLKEAQLAARVQHPNLVAAYSAFCAGGLVVLAMEYIEGRTLAQLVRDGGPLPVAEACRYARQAALGLQRVHDEGLVHRDLKPPNLMLSTRGEVKLLDFGLAKAVSEQADRALTGPGAMMGTPDYMAPEQARDAKSADIRADIYSLGCTLYFLLTGEGPFALASTYEVMHAHQELPAPPLTERCPRAPAALAELVARMLAKRPADRPQTPAEVAQALAAFLPTAAEDCPTLTPPPPPPAAAAVTVLTAAPRRRWPAARRGAVALAAVAAGLAVLWASGVFAPRPADPAPPDPDLTVPGHDAPPAVARQQLGPFTNSVGMKMVLIPAGDFLMGTPEAVGRPRDEGGTSLDDGRPQRRVTLTRPFCLGACEVTQGQFRAVMGYHPSVFSTDGTQAPGVDYKNDSQPAGKKRLAQGATTDDYPVENVTYAEAVEFCRRLTARDRREGRIRPSEEYRLPSEAQWEYACRAGTTTLFHFGDRLLPERAHYTTAEKYRDRHRTGGPKQVGSYPANAWGLYDMHGNVWEWCQDWYGEDYYVNGPRRDPAGPAAGERRVVRGGGWMNHEKGQHHYFRSAFRDHQKPGTCNYHLGFRAALVEVGPGE